MDTWVQVFCTCSGGELWIHDKGDGKMMKMVGERPVRFNAQLPHKTCPLKSRLSDMRVIVTYYVNRIADKLTKTGKRRLLAVTGAPPP